MASRWAASPERKFSRPFGGLAVRATAPAVVRALPSSTGRRTFSAIASTADPDRVGDVVQQSGWNLDAYRASGAPVYFEHHVDTAPVAKCRYIAVDPDAGGLIAEGEFPAAGKNELSDAVWEVLTVGQLQGLSVQFTPDLWEPLPTGGRLIKAATLREISFCRTPVNPSARVRRLDS